jgi:hypothetical protein
MNKQIIKNLKNINPIFLSNNKNGFKINKTNHTLRKGNIPILISAPHAVRQYRNDEIKASDYLTGALALSLAEELEKQSVPAVESCVITAVNKCPKLPKLITQRMEELSRSLGAFDLAGQLKSIKAINSENRQILKNIGLDYQVRLRSYKTLGICAGAALVILFI